MATRVRKYCGGVPNEYTDFMNVLGIIAVYVMREYHIYTGVF
jgi:hypothetical protein